MTSITDGVPFNTIDLITGNRITFARRTVITESELTVPDSSIMWDPLAIGWGDVGFELIWLHISTIPDTAVVWGSLAASWGGDGFEIIW